MEKNNPYLQNDDDIFNNDDTSKQNSNSLNNSSYIEELGLNTLVGSDNLDVFLPVMDTIPDVMKLYQNIFKRFLNYTSEYDTLNKYKKGLASCYDLNQSLIYYFHNILGTYMAEIFMKTYMNSKNLYLVDNQNMKQGDQEKMKELLIVHHRIIKQLLSYISEDMENHYREACDMLSVPPMISELEELKQMFLTEEKVDGTLFSQKMEAIYECVGQMNASL